MKQFKNNIVLATISAKTILDNIKSLQVDSHSLPINMLSNETISILLAQPMLCCLPSNRLGKSRAVENIDEVAVMLQSVSHVMPSTHLIFLRAMTHENLENTYVNVMFMPDTGSQINEHIHHMFFLSKYKKDGAKNGKLDYLALEKDFKKVLPKGKKIKDYIASSRKYSYAAFLAIHARTFTNWSEK